MGAVYTCCDSEWSYSGETPDPLDWEQQGIAPEWNGFIMPDFADNILVVSVAEVIESIILACRGNVADPHGFI